MTNGEFAKALMPEIKRNWIAVACMINSQLINFENSCGEDKAQCARQSAYSRIRSVKWITCQIDSLNNDSRIIKAVADNDMSTVVNHLIPRAAGQGMFKAVNDDRVSSM